MSVQQSTIEHAVPDTACRATRRLSRDWLLLKGALLALDASALGAAFGLAYIIRFKTGIPMLETPSHTVAFYSWVAFWAVPIWLGLFALYRLYDQHYLFAGLQEYIRVVNACTGGLVAVVIVSFLDVSLFISRGWLLIVWVLSMLFVGCSRFAFRRLLRRLRARGLLMVPTVIVGANEEGRALAEQFLADSASGLRVIGFVDNSLPAGTPVVSRLAVLGGLGHLEDIVQSGAASQIVVATTSLPHDELLDLYQTFGHTEGVEIRLSSGLFDILTTGVTVQELSCVPLMTPQRVRITGVDAFMKAVLDYTVAFCGLLALSPVLLIVALLVKVDSPGPVLYRRRVLGRGGKPFDAFKFRTMVVDADARLAADPELRQTFEESYKLRRDPRVTRLGRFLRRTSLDELPQLLNVLRGEMSLVGPRMIAPEEASRYGKWRLNLLTVKPGITGPWQIHGRSDIPYDERVRLSMHYIRNYTIWLDLGILARTTFVVLQGKGAY